MNYGGERSISSNKKLENVSTKIGLGIGYAIWIISV